MNPLIIRRSLFSVTWLAGALAGACAADVGTAENASSAPTHQQTEAVVAQSQGFAHVNSAGGLLRQYNSTGSAVTASKVAGTTGKYVVEFVNLPFVSNVQVVAASSGSQRCNLAGQALVGVSPPSALRLTVHCNSGSTGALQDTAFLIQVADGTATSSATDGAYLLTSIATPTSGTTITHSLSYNSASFPNGVTRSSTGKYSVIFQGITETKVNLHVTAYGTDGSGKYCKIKNSSVTTSPLALTTVNVNCYDAAGNAADSRFSIGNRGVKLAPTFGWGLASGLSVLNQKTLNACPGAPANTITITWPSAIQAHVYMPYAGEQTKGIPMVTASGDNNLYCNMAGGWTQGTDTYDVLVRPRCYSPGGLQTAAPFQILYSSTSLIPPC